MCILPKAVGEMDKLFMPLTVHVGTALRSEKSSRCGEQWLVAPEMKKYSVVKIGVGRSVVGANVLFQLMEQV